MTSSARIQIQRVIAYTCFIIVLTIQSVRGWDNINWIGLGLAAVGVLFTLPTYFINDAP